MSYDIQFGEFSTWFNAKEATIKLAEDPAAALTVTPPPGANPPAARPGPDWELQAPSMAQGGIGMGAGAALGALMGLATSDNDDEQPWKRALAMGLMTGALGLGAATAYASRPQDPDKPVHDSAARRFGRGATRAAKWGVNVIPEAVRGVGEELGLIDPGDPNVLQQLVEHLRSQGHNVTPEQVSQEISKAQATAKQPGMVERAGQFIGQVRKAPETFMKGYRSEVGKTTKPTQPQQTPADPAAEAIAKVPDAAQSKPSATTSGTAGAGPIAGTSGPSPSVSPVAPRTTASEGSTSHGPIKSDGTPGPLPDAKPAGQPTRAPTAAPGEGPLNLGAASRMVDRQKQDESYSAAIRDPKNKMSLPENEVSPVAPKPTAPIKAPGGAKPAGQPTRAPTAAPGEGPLNLGAASRMVDRQKQDESYSAAIRDPKNKMSLPENEVSPVAPKPTAPIKAPGGAKPGALSEMFNLKKSPVLQAAGAAAKGMGKLFTQPQHRLDAQNLHSQYAGGTY